METRWVSPGFTVQQRVLQPPLIEFTGRSCRLVDAGGPTRGRASCGKRRGMNLLGCWSFAFNGNLLFWSGPALFVNDTEAARPRMHGEAEIPWCSESELFRLSAMEGVLPLVGILYLPSTFAWVNFGNGCTCTSVTAARTHRG